MKEKKNQERKFYFAVALAELEGRDSEAITELKKMKEQGELEPWKILYIANLCRELHLEENFEEAREEVASTKAEVLSVETKVDLLRKRVEEQPESKEKEELMKITDVLQRIIDDQQETIKNHEETIRGLQTGFQQLINAHQQTIEEFRLTKDQFQSFKQNGSKENWWAKYSGELIVGVVTGIFGVIGTLLGIFL